MKGTFDFNNLGRIFYGISIAGIGVLHFIYPGFRGLISAIQPADPAKIAVIVYIFGLYLVVSGILIAAGKKVMAASLILASVLLLFLVFGHLPRRLTINPGRLGEWTNVLKLGSFVGGACLVAMSNAESTSNTFLLKLGKVAPYGKYLFCLMLIAFGIDHFLYTDFVKGLVPKWMPLPVFWTYFTGVALFGAGVALFINFKVKTVAILLAIMLFIWLFTVHLVLAIRYPEWNGGENITACFQCLAFTGIALVFSANPPTRPVRSQRPHRS